MSQGYFCPTPENFRLFAFSGQEEREKRVEPFFPPTIESANSPYKSTVFSLPCSPHKITLHLSFPVITLLEIVMPTPFDRKPFAERYHVNDYGVFFRITHIGDDGRIFGRNVRADNIQSIAGRRLLPKQIAYILHHGELPKFIIHKNRDQDDMRKDNLLGSDVHPRWANYEGVDVTTVRSATTDTTTPKPTAHAPDGYTVNHYLADLDK